VENRVSLVTDCVSKLKGISLIIEIGAGMASGFPDHMYSSAGGAIIATQKDLYDKSDVILKVQPPTKCWTDLSKKGSALISQSWIIFR
jgi:NAD/NADP transhydrogenase alpha subunit